MLKATDFFWTLSYRVFFAGVTCGGGVVASDVAQGSFCYYPYANQHNKTGGVTCLDKNLSFFILLTHSLA
jgi:hypothetical protein